MAIRIEYLLILAIVLFSVSIVGITPESKSAVLAKGDKEIYFENFVLKELHELNSNQKISASNMTKYENYFSLTDMNLTNESNDNIITKTAIYTDDMIVMKRDILLTSAEGLTFSSNQLNYDLKNRKVEVEDTFVMKFEKHQINGSNLMYNLQSRVIKADNIRASFWFTPQY